MQRILAYQNAVPIEGLIKLALFNQEPYQKLDKARDLIKGLQDVSLLEISESEQLHCKIYQASTQVRQWLEESANRPPTHPLLVDAAEYQLYLFKHESRTLTQAIQTHQALEKADQQNAADRFALDTIVGQLSLNGFFLSVLQHWLPKICESEDEQTRGEALGQMGKQLLHIGEFETALDYLKQSLAIRQEIGNKSGEGTTLNNMATTAHARGDYKTALDYLKQSLAITQEIGDIAGLCATLFNMGHIHWQNDEQQEAIGAWVTVYQLAKPRQQADALQALESLAGQLGLEGGLAAWEQLAERFEEQT